MKYRVVGVLALLAAGAPAFAQETTGGRIVVPARNTAHPRVVNCNTLNGAITVKTYSGRDVMVEDGRGPRTAPGEMKRIGMPARGLEVVEDDNVITIRQRAGGNANLIISVPADTSLRLRSLSGAIHVEGLHGEVDVHTLSGAITLTDISGTVTADSQNGAIKVGMDSVDPGKPLAFSTFHGVVDVTFPPDLKANLTVKTNHGAVYSDFEVTLGGAGAGKNGASGVSRLRIDNTIHGVINGGGPDLTIRTFSGSVYIRKKK